ncbi:hypothetical protein M0813_12017 [Anaeramoeba flamelloides]|uniref:Transmembrane protein n=1 Tax=Anaeramoeba flamelloides TaxID=1746091 RepID=A0ABQ8ZE56_9EUKA|nr:hypothetical protein M0813_12017 [Anaeramoeba flamelloides]
MNNLNFTENNQTFTFKIDLYLENEKQNQNQNQKKKKIEKEKENIKGTKKEENNNKNEIRFVNENGNESDEIRYDSDNSWEKVQNFKEQNKSKVIHPRNLFLSQVNKYQTLKQEIEKHQNQEKVELTLNERIKKMSNGYLFGTLYLFIFCLLPLLIGLKLENALSSDWIWVFGPSFVSIGYLIVLLSFIVVAEPGNEEKLMLSFLSTIFFLLLLIYLKLAGIFEMNLFVTLSPISVGAIPICYYFGIMIFYNENEKDKNDKNDFSLSDNLSTAGINHTLEFENDSNDSTDGKTQSNNNNTFEKRKSVKSNNNKNNGIDEDDIDLDIAIDSDSDSGNSIGNGNGIDIGNNNNDNENNNTINRNDLTESNITNLSENDEDSDFTKNNERLIRSSMSIYSLINFFVFTITGILLALKLDFGWEISYATMFGFQIFLISLPIILIIVCLTCFRNHPISIKLSSYFTICFFLGLPFFITELLLLLNIQYDAQINWNFVFLPISATFLIVFFCFLCVFGCTKQNTQYPDPNQFTNEFYTEDDDDSDKDNHVVGDIVINTTTNQNSYQNED